jgi:hypothetical protein
MKKRNSGRAADQIVASEKGIAPHIPVFDRSKRDDGAFSRSDFRYDPTGDVYHCPAGKILTATGTLVNGMRGVAGSERWRQEQTHPGLLADHAARADRALGYASGARTASQFFLRSSLDRSNASVPGEGTRNIPSCFVLIAWNLAERDLRTTRWSPGRSPMRPSALCSVRVV